MKTPAKPTKKHAAEQTRREAIEAARSAPLPADPLAPENLRKLALRIGIPVLVGWVIAFVLKGWIPKAVVGVLTLALAGLALWARRFAKKSRKVAEIVRGAGNAEERKEALEKLSTDFKKDDTAALFAKAQLEMQDDPRMALKTLEGIPLDKLMAPAADEARVQRAMIHLLLGETDKARPLVDAVDLTRHKDSKARATVAAIVGETWARTGDAKRAVDLLETFDPSDEAFAELRPQLWRARAFAYAWSQNSRQMRTALRALAALNPQYLTGFITRKKHPMGVNSKGVHPLLEKEAYDMVQRSGMVPRRTEFRRG